MVNVRLKVRGLPGAARKNESVAGFVRVELDRPEDVELRVVPYVTVAHDGSVLGRGPRDGVVAHQGPLGAGTHDVPFRLPALAGPASYAGRELRIDWVIEASAKTAAQSVRAEAPVTLRPAHDARMEVSPLRGIGSHADLKGSSSGCAVAALVATLALAAGAVGGWTAGEPDLWMTFAFFGVGAGLLTVGLVRSQLLYRRVGSPELRVEPTVLEPGLTGQLSVSVRHRPGASVEAVDVRFAVVECRLRANEGAQNLSETPVVSRTSSLQRSGDGEWSGAVELPEPGSVPCTYMTSDRAQIRWVVRSQLRGPGIGDGQARTTVWLDARPETARDAEPRQPSPTND